MHDSGQLHRAGHIVYLCGCILYLLILDTAGPMHWGFTKQQLCYVASNAYGKQLSELLLCVMA